jgi:formylglycine-generating enzyme required for sulfatase activity
MLKEYEWFHGNSELKSHRVKGKRPNDWVLCDMNGSVWEWRQDCYGGYPPGPVLDFTGPSGGSYKVVRGGAWYFYAESCRSASRNCYAPGYS